MRHAEASEKAPEVVGRKRPQVVGDDDRRTAQKRQQQLPDRDVEAHRNTRQDPIAGPDRIVKLTREG